MGKAGFTPHRNSFYVNSLAETKVSNNPNERQRTRKESSASMQTQKLNYLSHIQLFRDLNQQEFLPRFGETSLFSKIAEPGIPNLYI